MNNKLSMFLASAFFWLIATVIMVLSFAMVPESATWIAIAALIAAMISTVAVFGAWSSMAVMNAQENFAFEKPKREKMQVNPMQALMELMDDDEREAFKEQLKQQILNNNGNVNSEGELLYDAETYEALMRGK